MVWCVSPYSLRQLLPCFIVGTLATVLSVMVAKPAQAQFADSTSAPTSSQSSQDQHQSQTIPEQKAGVLVVLDEEDIYGVNPSTLAVVATDSAVTDSAVTDSAVTNNVESDPAMTIVQFVPTSKPSPVPPEIPSVTT